MRHADMTAPNLAKDPEKSLPENITQWRGKIITLRYSLSYVKLFELKFNALEDPRPFSPDRPVIRSYQPPIDAVPNGYDVVAARNVLIEAEIPVIHRLPGILCYAPRQLVHFYTDLRGGSAAAFKMMSSKTRSTLVRKVKGYKELCGGEIPWKVYRTPEEMASFLELARDLAEKTYQERLFESGLPDSEEFRANCLELARRDAVRAYLLFHEGKHVAYLYAPAPDGILIYDYMGYDPAYAAHSPGTVLQYLALQSLYEEGRFPLYHWGYGYTQTKKIFSTGQVLGADIFYFRPTWRNRTAVRLHYATDRFAHITGRLLDRLQLKHAIKRRLKGQ